MIHKIILGTVQLGLEYGINNKSGLPDDKEVKQIFSIAESCGIRKLDTAAVYGKAEERIGDYHSNNNKPFQVITKINKEKASWKESVKNSLDRMKIPMVETLLFHSFKDFQDHKSQIQFIVDSGQNTLFKTIGVSVYTNEELEELISIDEVQVIQMPFNLLDNEIQRAEIIKRLKDRGKTIHTRSSFLQGLFFKSLEDITPQLKPLTPFLKEIKTIAKNNFLEVGHLALQYALQKDYIDGVLFGVDSVFQLGQNIQWTEKKINTMVFDQIDKIDVSNPELLNPAKWH